MAKKRPRIPVGLLISIVVLLILGAIAGPIIQSLATPEQLANNVLLGAVPFILIFVAIVLAFITLIVLVASMLNENIAPRPYRLVESILIAGIVVGVVGMFQPWLYILYKFGFLILLVSTLGYILWSHIAPKGFQRQEELGVLSISDSDIGKPGGGD
ncbi:MAG: hypothetical protein P8X95_24100 [Anaerolineales bacterium]|jgi:hypothetical protein